MSEGTSLINFDGLSEPATKLIEKISDGIEGLCKPYQIKRIAKAEAAASIIKLQSEIDSLELQRQKRAIERFIGEETQRQLNMESIIQKALPDISDTAKPEDMENDWIVNFFDKCRIISGEEMQSLWARVLAGEANAPGTYSKRTVNFLNSLDKSDAQLFTTLRGFCWEIDGDQPLIYDYNAPIYKASGINFDTLSHLANIDLINFHGLRSVSIIWPFRHIAVNYYGTQLAVELIKPGEQEDYELNIGQVRLTKIGAQLAPISGGEAVSGFFDYVVGKLAEIDYKPFSPLLGATVPASEVGRMD